MKRSKKRIRLCVALLILNVLFIWGNSMLPGSVSAVISGWVRDLLAAIFGGDDGTGTGHGLIRKLAHFTEFACLGSLFAWLFGMLGKKTIWALLCGFLAASADETIQIFVPNRGPRILDVLLHILMMLPIGCLHESLQFFLFWLAERKVKGFQC